MKATTTSPGETSMGNQILQRHVRRQKGGALCEACGGLAKIQGGRYRTVDGHRDFYCAECVGMGRFPSVESGLATRKVSGKAGLPMPTKKWQPTPLVTIDPDDLAPSVATIVARIAEVERSRGCGAYLFIETDMRAYVISEEKPAAMEWVKARFAALVAMYAPTSTKGVPAMAPTVEGVTEDVAYHLGLLPMAVTA